MNLLHRLFGNDFRDENSNAKFELYNVLCKSIIEASWNCYLTVKDEIEIQDTDEAQTLRVSIYFEYLNFYMHLTNRLAHFKLNHIQHNSMQKYVGEFISEIAINTFFNTQPQQVKDSITSDFIYNLNISEMDYSSSKEIISSHHDFTGNSV